MPYPECIHYVDIDPFHWKKKADYNIYFDLKYSWYPCQTSGKQSLSADSPLSVSSADILAMFDPQTQQQVMQWQASLH